MNALLLAAVLVVRGIVVQTEPGDRAFIHHEAFGGMPAMTMEFSLPPGTQVHPGDRIAGEVDETRSPWSLSHVEVRPATTPPPVQPAPQALSVGDAVPDIAFLDQRGRSVTLSSLRGRAYALTFIYTRCQVAQMCPLISAKYHAVQAKLPPKTLLVEVTLDPAYDRPAVLARYAAARGARSERWLLLTGSTPSVLAFAQRFGVFERRAAAQTIVHTERLAIVDRAGRVSRFLDDPAWTPAQLLAALNGS